MFVQANARPRGEHIWESGGACSDANLVLRSRQAEGVREDEGRTIGEHICPSFVFVEFPKGQALQYMLVSHENFAPQYGGRVIVSALSATCGFNSQGGS